LKTFKLGHQVSHASHMLTHAFHMNEQGKHGPKRTPRWAKST